MKSKLTNFISLAVVMFVLTAVFTVSALANITGGFGVIEGLDDAKTYEAASVTINATGDGYAEDTAFELNDTTNQDLAGLYIVWEKDNKDDTKTDVIYVNGGIADKQALFEIGSDSKIVAVADKATEFTVGSVVSSNGWEARYTAPYNCLVSLGGIFTKFTNKVTTTEYEKKTEFESRVEKLTSTKFLYAYTSDEIVPVSQLESYSWGMSMRYSPIKYNNLSSKYIAYIMTPDGTVTKYEYTHKTENLSTGYASSESSKNLYASGLIKTVDFTAQTTESGSWTTALPTEGWLVGFEIYPLANMNNYSNVVKGGSTNHLATFSLIVNFSSAHYVVNKPTQTAPTGLTVEGTTISGLDANLEYVAVPFTVNGGDTSKQIEISGVESYTFPADKAGLWGICFKETDEVALSAPSELVYIEGKWAVRQDLFEVDPSTDVTVGASGTDFVEGSLISTKGWEARYEGTHNHIFNYGVIFNSFKSSSTAIDTEKKTEFESQVTNLTSAKFLYAYTSEEIIPISQVKSYSWGLAIRYSPIQYKDLVSKFVAHVMAPDGTVNKYEYLHTATLLERGYSGSEKANLFAYDNQVMTVDFTAQTTDSGKWTTALPTEGYLVGFEVYPLYGMNDYANVLDISPVGSGTKFIGNFSLLISNDADNYEIIVTKKPTPTGLTVEDTTVNGLDSATTYVAVPYDIFGAHIENQIDIPAGSTSFTFDADTQAGIWGISVKGDDYFYNSDPSELIYIAGPSAKRQELGNFTMGAVAHGRPLADFDASTSQFVVGKFTGSLSNAGGTNIENSYRYLAQFGLTGDAQKLWLYDNTKEAVKAILDEIRTEEVKANPTNNGQMMQDIVDKFYDNSVQTNLIDVTIAGKDAGTIAAERMAIAESVKDTLSKLSLLYAYSSDEIIPVGDLYTFTYGIMKEQGGIYVEDAKAKFTFSVMDNNGEIDTYSVVSNPFNFTTNGISTLNIMTVDVQSIANWPTEGWIVGFKLEPFYEVDANKIYSSYANDVKTALLKDSGDLRFHAAQLAMAIYSTPSTYVIKVDAPTPTLSSFPLIAGGCGQISGLNPNYLYEYRYSDDDGATFSSWSDIPAGSTAVEVTAAGTYQVRVKNTAEYGKSQIAEIVVAEYASLDADVLPYTQEITKIHLPNDFVELKAEYEMDLTVKKWVSTLALENIKTLSPESTITIVGENHKIVITAANIVTDEKVHYYNMDVSLFGSSRFNASEVEMYKELAGENYITDVYFESANGLPFEEGQLMIKLGDKYDGLDVELNSYNDKINRLRLVEASTVYDGWVTFTNCDSTYVIVLAD